MMSNISVNSLSIFPFSFHELFIDACSCMEKCSKLSLEYFKSLTIVGAFFIGILSLQLKVIYPLATRSYNLITLLVVDQINELITWYAFRDTFFGIPA